MSINQLIKDIPVVNIAANLPDDELNDIGQYCHQGYQDDLSDPKRQKWAEGVDEWVKLAMQVTEEKSDPWEGCANIKIPLLIEAAVQFNARAMPALIPSTNIVKTTKTGEDPDNAKEERGERIGKHMSYQLQEEMTEWEDDMDKGLLVLPIAGCFFKKTYYNPELGRNESTLVMGQNLVMKYDSPNVERAPRKTEEIKFYPREVEEKQRSKVWSDVEIVFKDEEKEELESFICQHVNLDIRKTGYKIPYIVTIHKKTQKVMRIVANYTESDIHYNDGTEVVSVQKTKDKIDSQNQAIDGNNMEAMAIAQQAGSTEQVVQVPKVPYPEFNKYKVLRVDPTEYYTKYGFIPAPDCSVYDLGFGQLLGPLTDAADSLINQSLDAGTLSNLQGGIKAKGAKVSSGTGRVNVNEWTEVETMGATVRDSFIPFNFKGPSATAFALIEFLIGFAKDVANLKDILSGDAPAGETATTSMIKREEGMRVYNAIYKRIYRAFKKELSKLYDLNAQYLPQEGYFQVLDDQMAIKKVDYSRDKTDVRPTADPTDSTQSQRIMKSEAGMQFVQDPMFNAYELKKNYLEAIEYPGIDVVLPNPQDQPKPPPDPDLVLKTAQVAKTEMETKKLALETAEVISKVILNLAKAEGEEAGNQIGMLKAHADLLIKKGVENGTDKGGDSGVAQQPGNGNGKGAL